MANFALMTDVELLAWMDNFVTVALPTPEKYGVTKVQVQEIEAIANDLRGNIAARQTADDAAKAAVMAQGASRHRSEPKVSYLNTIIKADLSISVADKLAVGVDMPKPRTKTAPVRPEDLVVNGFEDGRNVLKWKRAGNKAGTQFIVESKADGATEFSYLATTTETKYEHRGAKVGLRCLYRVKAQRSGEESTYSNEAMVY